MRTQITQTMTSTQSPNPPRSQNRMLAAHVRELRRAEIVRRARSRAGTQAMPRTPSVEATSIADVMHEGVISAPPATSLRDIATRMANLRLHCVLVEGAPSEQDSGGAAQQPWRMISDSDLLQAIAAGLESCTAGELAASEVVTIPNTASVAEGARLMAAHECSHLLVVSSDGSDVGVVSSLDVARAVASSPGPGPGSPRAARAA
jgi:CBS domain-containing protein